MKSYFPIAGRVASEVTSGLRLNALDSYEQPGGTSIPNEYRSHGELIEEGLATSSTYVKDRQAKKSETENESEFTSRDSRSPPTYFAVTFLLPRPPFLLPPLR